MAETVIIRLGGGVETMRMSGAHHYSVMKTKLHLAEAPWILKMSRSAMWSPRGKKEVCTGGGGH